MGVSGPYFKLASCIEDAYHYNNILYIIKASTRLHLVTKSEIVVDSKNNNTIKIMNVKHTL